MIRGATIAIAVILIAGCGGDRNDVCEWAPPAGDRSLIDDVRLAEDLAIRYADARGKRESWRSTREGCEARLFRAIADQHDSSLAEIASIREGFSRRGLDLAVYGPMLGLCGLASWWLVRATALRFGASEPIPRACAVVVGTLVIAAAVIGIGQVWAGLVEAIRIGNGHLSYRASRIPWAHHRLATGIGVVLVVSLTLVLKPQISRLTRG